MKENIYILCETLNGSNYYDKMRAKKKIEEYYNQSVVNDGRIEVYIGEMDNLNEGRSNAERYALSDLPLDLAPEFYVLVNPTYDWALIGHVECYIQTYAELCDHMRDEHKTLFGRNAVMPDGWLVIDNVDTVFFQGNYEEDTENLYFEILASLSCFYGARCAHPIISTYSLRPRYLEAISIDGKPSKSLEMFNWSDLMIREKKFLYTYIPDELVDLGYIYRNSMADLYYEEEDDEECDKLPSQGRFMTRDDELKWYRILAAKKDQCDFDYEYDCDCDCDDYVGYVDEGVDDRNFIWYNKEKN